MLFPEMIAQPVIVTNSRGMSADTIAEHVLAVTLAMFRRLPDAVRLRRKTVWAQDASGLAGNRTLAGGARRIVGLGSIGGGGGADARARRARDGIRRNPDAAADGADRVVGAGALRDVLPDADVSWSPRRIRARRAS